MSFTPTTLYSNYLNQYISFSKAVDLLLNFIENNCDPSIRLDSLDILIKIAPQVPETYNILERCLISEEEEIIRARAAELLSTYFLEKSLKSLIWSIRNEKSFLVLSTFRHIINEIDNPLIFDEFQKRIDKLSYRMSIDTKDFVFVLDQSNTIDDIRILRNKEMNLLFLNQNTITLVKKGRIRGVVFSLLKKVPKTLYRLERVDYLDLSFNYLKKLSSEIFKLRELQLLNLKGNEFNHFPTIFRSFKIKNLLSLNLSYNYINEIPDWIGELYSLKSLDLSYNELNSLPKSISNLINLESLNIEHNKLREIPDEIYNMKSLKKLII
ncbi:MAG: leucine-rich repeat domain-containing protein [Promethearchaeati archaeon]